MAGKKSEEIIRCSFCGKTQAQVRKLIAGPNGAFICDECVEVCSEIIEEELDFEEDSVQEEINLLTPEELKAFLYLNEGCIVAQRHIHMSPADAAAAGVKDGDIVSVQAENERGTTFNHVKIRVHETFTLEMHIDTDEANAAGIKQGDTVRMFK